MLLAQTNGLCPQSKRVGELTSEFFGNYTMQAYLMAGAYIHAAMARVTGSTHAVNVYWDLDQGFRTAFDEVWYRLGAEYMSAIAGEGHCDRHATPLSAALLLHRRQSHAIFL